MENRLDKLRVKLNSIDQNFMDLLAQRTEIIDEIKAIKAKDNLSAYQPKIEANKALIFEKYAQENEQSSNAFRELYKCLHRISLKQQQDS